MQLSLVAVLYPPPFPPSGIKKEAVSLFRRINLDMLRPLVCRPVLNASAANLQVLRGERKLQ